MKVKQSFHNATVLSRYGLNTLSAVNYINLKLRWETAINVEKYKNSEDSPYHRLVDFIGIGAPFMRFDSRLTDREVRELSLLLNELEKE